MDSTDNPDEEYEIVEEELDNDLLNYGGNDKQIIKLAAGHLAEKVYETLYGLKL